SVPHGPSAPAARPYHEDRGQRQDPGLRPLHGVFESDTFPHMESVRDALSAALGDRYTIDRVLGRGGMATVYVAEDLRHSRQVAIKVLRGDVAAAIGAERFLREIAIAARLTHPHVLPLIDSGQAAGDRERDGRCDVYSLACVVYEMLAGEPPFSGPSARAIVAKHLSESPPPIRARRPDAPAAVEQALARALAKDPADRFASVAEFTTALEQTRPEAVSSLVGKTRSIAVL